MRVLLPIALITLTLIIMVTKRNPATTTAIAPQVPPAPTDTILIVLDHFRFDTLLNTQRNIALFDLRTPAEFATGHIWRSSNLNAADPLFDNRLSALGKENEYALYDSNGSTAAEVGRKMKERGFKKIYVLKDGLLNWSETGRALQLH